MTVTWRGVGERSLVEEQLMELGLLCLEKRMRGNQVVGQVMAPQDVFVLTPGICDCVPLPGQRDFAGVIML